MLNYLVRRLLIGLVTLIAITFLVFGLIRSMPGSPALMAMAEASPDREIDPADLERMNRDYGLDKPWYESYTCAIRYNSLSVQSVDNSNVWFYGYKGNS